MRDDNKQVQLSDEMAAMLADLPVDNTAANDSKYGLLIMAYGYAIFYPGQFVKNSSIEITPTGRAALQVHKAQSKPPCAYQINEPEAEHGIDMELAAHMYMAAAWYYGGIELWECDELAKAELASEIESAIEAYKTKAEGSDK